MSYAIVFSSKTGNTKLLADTLHACLPQENCCYFGTPDPAAMEADDLYVGFWTDKGNADESTLDFLKQLHSKNIFLFGTAGFGGSEEYYTNPVPLNFARIIDIFLPKNPPKQCPVQIHSPSIESSSLVDYQSSYNIAFPLKIKVPATFAHGSHSEP